MKQSGRISLALDGRGAEHRIPVSMLLDDRGAFKLKLTQIIDAYRSEGDPGGKPLHRFPYPALERYRTRLIN